MAEYTINYTSANINSYLQKGSGLYIVDTSGLITKTSASNTYITQTSMANTYQPNGSYTTSSLSSKCTTTTWSNYVSNWATYYSNALIYARNCLYPVGSLFFNWNSATSPSWGSWTQITNSGLLCGYSSNNGNSNNTTVGSNTKTMAQSEGVVSYTISFSTVSNGCHHYHLNDDTTFPNWIGVSSSASVSTYAVASPTSSGSSNRFFRSSASPTVSVFSSTDIGTLKHSHSGITYPSKTATSTIDVRQTTDTIYCFYRTA